MLKNDLAETISLEGSWAFSLGELSPQGEIFVPGCWESQGYSKFMDGPATYRKEIDFPERWAGQTILAHFEAVSYFCTVYLNGIEVGTHQGLWTPFSIDLTSAAQFGCTNILELKVFKPGDRYPMRSSLAGFIPDIATTFGGIWQPARITALKAGLDDFWIAGDVLTHQLQIHAQAVILTASQKRREWNIDIFKKEAPVVNLRLPFDIDGILNTSVYIPQTELWSQENPVLYTAQVTLLEGGKPTVQATLRTGFRRLSTAGNQLLFNERPILLRGILSWGWEPDRIVPTYSADQTRAEIRRVRALGFNLIKLCLFVPNQTYFDIADEEGMLIWQEMPMWLPQMTADLRDRSPSEYANITRQIRHHPSVVLYSLGCELNQSIDGEFLSLLNSAVRNQVSNVLVCDNSGSGESYGGLDFDFSDFSDYHPYYDLHYFEPLLDNWRRDWQTPRPVILGEFCDSDTFRDLNEIITANNGQKPWWMTPDNPVTTWRTESKALLEAQQRIEQAQTGFTAQELARISYAQSMVIRKYTLELLHRRVGIGGYVLTGLRDTPISTSGFFDDFNRSKWTSEELLPINNDAVLCLDVGRRRRWRHGGDRPEFIDLQNLWSGQHGSWHIILSQTRCDVAADSQVTWTLKGQTGNPIAAGTITVDHAVSQGMPTEVGVIACRMPAFEQAAELQLEIVFDSNNLHVENHWPIWVYPTPEAHPENLVIVDPAHCFDEYGDWSKLTPGMSSTDHLEEFNIVLTTTWDAHLQRFVQNGGKALLMQQGSGPFPALRLPFWREGIKLFCEHPIWRKFPQRGFSDMQFFSIASDTAFDTSQLSQVLPAHSEVRHVMRRFDAREFRMSEYVFEAGIGKGVLLACALQLQGGGGRQPTGWLNNVPGTALLSIFLEYLTRNQIEA